MGVGGQHHAPAASPLKKTWHPLYRRLGGTQGRSGRVRKISPPPGFDPRTIQPIAQSLYRLGYTAHIVLLVGKQKLQLIFRFLIAGDILNGSHL